MSRWQFCLGLVLTVALASTALSVDFGHGDETQLTPASRKILEALKSESRIEFIDTPLQDVIAFLRDAHRIRIELDQQAMSAVGIKMNTPVTRDLKRVTLHSALRLILGQLGLSHVVRNDVLLITTEAESKRLVRDGAFDPTGLKSPHATTASKKIAEALQRPVPDDFVGTPLDDVVVYLTDQFDIPIQIDDRGLARQGVRRKVPCTTQHKGLALESALGPLLRNVGLTFVVEDEYILITAPKAAR